MPATRSQELAMAPGTWYRALVRYLVLGTTYNQYGNVAVQFGRGLFLHSHSELVPHRVTSVRQQHNTMQQIMQSCEGNQARRLGKCFILFTPHGSDHLCEICWKGNRFSATNCQDKALPTAKVLKVLIENGTFLSLHRHCHNGSLG